MEEKDEIDGALEKHDTSTFDSASIGSEDEDFRFGYGWFTPSWLQWHHNAKFLLLWLGLCAFVQSFVVNAVFPAGLSTLEKQFKMTSTSTGIISSWYDLAVLLVVFPICHFGHNAHKGRWIGVGCLVMAIGSFICTLPHFLADIYDPLHVANVTEANQCIESPVSGLFDTNFLLFILGQTLHGFGSTPLFSIGTAYIDENVSQSASPLYLALHAFITALGPMAGLVSASFLLKVYVDFDRVAKVPIDRDDFRWLGAWWIGFAIGSLAAFLVALPILGFARELPEARRHRAKDVNQTQATSKTVSEKLTDKGGVQETVGIIMGILRNPAFLVVTAIGIAEGIIVNGFSAFMPKILETLLGVDSSSASILSSLVIVAAAVGLIAGGILVRSLKLQVPGMFKFLVICEIASLLFLGCFFLYCPRTNVGINEDYDCVTDTDKMRLHTCDHCDGWKPVCDQVGRKSYFTACHAECSDPSASSLKIDHCTAPSNRSYKDGNCVADCGWKIHAFMVLLFFLVVMTFASGIPTQQIMLRVVHFDHRSLAIGINWTLLRLLGFIPGGILFGFIIDKSCSKWSEGCSSSCRLYDPYLQSLIIFGLGIVGGINFPDNTIIAMRSLSTLLTSYGALVCKLVAVLACILGYMTYTPSLEGEGTASLATVDTHAPLSLVVNDDRNQMPGPDSSFNTYVY